jgi:hypothetical protein
LEVVVIHFVDIETAPDPERAKNLMPSFDPESIKTGNIKDPELIKSKISERRMIHEKKWIEDAALWPETGRVLAIGILSAKGWPGPSESESVIFHVNQSDEQEILESWWDVFQSWNRSDGRRFGGFAIFHFDLPFLILRSRILGVSIPMAEKLRSGRYFSTNLFCDLQEEWLLGRSRHECNCSLDHVAKSLGVGAKTQEAKNFGRLYASDEAAALSYLRNDLAITRAVADKLGLL